MTQSRPLYLVIIGVIALLVAFSGLNEFMGAESVSAQDVPGAETPTEQPTEPPTATPTNTTVPPTATPPLTATPTNTEAPPATATPTEISEPGEPSAPVQIPEPVTVVLFGTGLAALSAAAASRRKQDGNDAE